MRSISVAYVVLGLLSAGAWVASAFYSKASSSLNRVAALCALAVVLAGWYLQARQDRQLNQMTAQLIGRQLSQAQSAALIQALRAVKKPVEPITIMGLQGDREAVLLAHALKPVFEAAGFTVGAVYEDILLGGTGPGILVRQGTADDPIGVGVAEALGTQGLSSRVVALGEDRAKGGVEIVVAYRPTE